MIQIQNPEAVVRLYYERLELSNDDIKTIFGKISSATITRLKKQARKQMAIDESPVWNAMHVNTRSAYKAWNLDIDDFERRLAKLRKLGFAPEGKPENSSPDGKSLFETQQNTGRQMKK